MSFPSPSLRTLVVVGASILAGGYAIHRLVQYIYNNRGSGTGGDSPLATTESEIKDVGVDFNQHQRTYSRPRVSPLLL